MNIKFLLDLIGASFEILIAYLFFRLFLERWHFKFPYVVAIFSVAFIAKVVGSYWFPEAWMRTVWATGCYFLLASCFKGTIVRKATMTGFLCLVAILPEYIVHGLLMLLVGDVYAIGMHSIQDYALGMFISYFIVIFFCLFFYYWKRSKKEQYSVEMNRRWYFFFLMYPIITLIVLIQNYYLILNDEQMIYVKWFLLSSVLMIISNVILFQILGEMQQLQADKLKAELAEQQLIAQEKHYEELIERNKAIKKYIHDTKNLLLILQSYVMQGNLEDVKCHLQSMLDNLSANNIEYTGNIVLDTVLSAKINEAKNNAVVIVPAIALYGNLNIKVIDLALLLGNALDNAIEATMRLDENQSTAKKIYLTVKLYQDILHIVVKNPIAHPVQMKDNRIMTTKKNKELHGLGIPNMQALAQKYNGTLDIRYTDRLFILNIVLENEEGIY